MTDSSSVRFVAFIVSASTSFSPMGSLLVLKNFSLWPKADKALLVGPGHVPILAKLVAKITEDQFMELADLHLITLWALELEPQAFLEEKPIGV